MFTSILGCIRRVFSDANAWGGTVSGFMGWISDFSGHKLLVPSWAWWILSIVLLFVVAVRIEYELLKERDANRKPKPDMPLFEVIRRIRGKEDIFGEAFSESMEITKAFRRLEELAASGAITIFGVRGLRYVPDNGHVEGLVTRLPIPRTAWETHKFEYMAFLQDQFGRVGPNNPHEKDEVGTGWGYIWFDSKEIEAEWPKVKRRIEWRNPFILKTGT